MNISAASQDYFIPAPSQTKEPKGPHRKTKMAMGYTLDRPASLTQRKRHTTNQDRDQLPHAAKVLKARAISKPRTAQTESLHRQIFTDLTAGQGKGNEIFGDFWDAFSSILDSFSNHYQGGDSPVNEVQVLAEWMPGIDAGREIASKPVKTTGNNRFHKMTTIHYLWDQAKNILMRGLKDGEKYFAYETGYKIEKRSITAWECLDIFLTRYISHKGWKLPAELLRQQLTSSLHDPKPTEADKKKIRIKHCSQFLKPEDIDSKGKALFGHSQWNEITTFITTSYKDYKPSRQESSTPGVHDIFLQALKDFLRIMPEMPGHDEVNDLHPETGVPIRRTVATTEFNISSLANKLNSEQTFATLIYPLVHARKYHLKKQDIEKYEFLLAAVMNLKQYYFIVADFRNTHKNEFVNEELWKNEHQYHSIFPFLLAFKPGVSSIPSGKDPEIGEDIDYPAFTACFTPFTSPCQTRNKASQHRVEQEAEGSARLLKRKKQPEVSDPRLEASDLRETLIAEKAESQKSREKSQPLTNTPTDREKRIKQLEEELKSARVEIEVSKNLLLESNKKIDEIKNNYQAEIKTLENNIETLNKEKDFICHLLEESEKHDLKLLINN